jgi:hypothetical protein
MVSIVASHRCEEGASASPVRMCLSAHRNTSRILTASYKKEIREPRPESVKGLWPLYMWTTLLASCESRTC